ncbi:MAG: helix-turn-helix domain-containing protein [Polyangiaceae bacterium]|nr:helix-turn-helix domain-containing protein [Polyangiaceae bacterium]
MDLSIREAAALLGKSERTVRYFAQQGRIPARRVRGQWIIDGDALEAAREPRREQIALIRERLNRSLDRATPPPAAAPPPLPAPPPALSGSASATVAAPVTVAAPATATMTAPVAAPAAPPSLDPRRSFYSARDLEAHRAAAEVLVALESAAGAHPHARAPLAEPATALRHFLRALTDGCHQFHPPTKVERFVRARSLLSGAVADIVSFNLLHPQPDLATLADRLERDALGALRGLLRRAERPRAERARA